MNSTLDANDTTTKIDHLLAIQTSCNFYFYYFSGFLFFQVEKIFKVKIMIFFHLMSIDDPPVELYYQFYKPPVFVYEDIFITESTVYKLRLGTHLR